MCRQPENCGRHMECACYFVGKVSAIGRQPPGEFAVIPGADPPRRPPLADSIRALRFDRGEILFELGSQLMDLEGLGQIVVHAGFETTFAVSFERVRGQGDDGN